MTLTLRKQPQKRVLRAGVIGLVLIGAVPASAAVIVKNFMKADVARVESCLKSLPGTDALTYPNGVPSLAVTSDTALSSEGVPLLRQVIAVRGVKPERTISADAVRIRNRCNRPLTVNLLAAPHGALPAISGEWNSLSMRVILSAASTPSPATDALAPIAPTAFIAAGNSFTDPTVAASWDVFPVRVVASAGGVGSLSNSSTSGVVLPANSDLQIAVVIDSGDSAVATDAVLRLIVKAVG